MKKTNPYAPFVDKKLTQPYATPLNEVEAVAQRESQRNLTWKKAQELAARRRRGERV